MGLFGEKTACPVCGSPGGGLLAVKIKNGVALCKECSRKVRMDKSMLSLQTVDDIKKHLKYREENLKKFNSFSPSSEIKTNHVSVFRIDKNQKLWYASFKTDVNPPLFRYDEIIDYELSEDGNTVTKGGIGSAMVGGALFGGVGAVVGGIHGKKSQTQIKSINLHISLSNPYVQSLDIEFVVPGMKVMSGDYLHKKYKTTANNVIALLDGMCREVEAEQQKPAPAAAPASAHSVADEIMKYKQLLDCGAITEEEFKAKKKQLLGF